jgi:hypothetical protein
MIIPRGEKVIICPGNGQSREALGRDFSAISQEMDRIFSGGFVVVLLEGDVIENEAETRPQILTDGHR